MHQLDLFIISLKIKHESENTLSKEKRNPVYYHELRILANLRRRGSKRKNKKKAAKQQKLVHTLKTSIPETFTKITFRRHGPDFCVVLKGTQKTGQDIYEKINSFLISELKVQYPKMSSLIHLIRDDVPFLGYKISTSHKICAPKYKYMRVKSA